MPCFNLVLHFLLGLGFIVKERQTSCGGTNVCVSQGRHFKIWHNYQGPHKKAKVNCIALKYFIGNMICWIINPKFHVNSVVYTKLKYFVKIYIVWFMFYSSFTLVILILFSNECFSVTFIALTYLYAKKNVIKISQERQNHLNKKYLSDPPHFTAPLYRNLMILAAK